MQNFLGSLHSPAVFNIIINITLLENVENNTSSYILSSLYMAATVATGEGNFDMEMQDFGALFKIAKLHELPRGGGGLRPPGPPTRAPPWT